MEWEIVQWKDKTRQRLDTLGKQCMHEAYVTIWTMLAQ